LLKRPLKKIISTAYKLLAEKKRREDAELGMWFDIAASV